MSWSETRVKSKVLNGFLDLKTLFMIWKTASGFRKLNAHAHIPSTYSEQTTNLNTNGHCHPLSSNIQQAPDPRGSKDSSANTSPYEAAYNLPIASSSLCLFMNEGWPLPGHERVTEARLLLRLLV